MITRLIIENFKAIKDRQEIDLRPITLLFGPNSGGKSTIIHAIHYLRHILDRKNPNVGPELDVLGEVNLGGFTNLVHGHVETRDIVLGAEFKMPHPGELSENPTLVERLRAKIDRVSLTLTIHHSDFVISRLFRVTIEVNGEPLAEFDPIDPGDELQIYWRHPIFASVEFGEHPADQFQRAIEEILGVDGPMRFWREQMKTRRALGDGSSEELENPVSVSVATWLHGGRDYSVTDPKTLVVHCAEPATQEQRNAANFLAQVLTPVIAEPIAYLRHYLLKDFGHLGPLRVVPSSRQMAEQRVRDETVNWYNGVAAWDMLRQPTEEDRALWSRVTDALHSLDTGLKFELSTFRDFEYTRTERDMPDRPRMPGQLEELIHVSRDEIEQLDPQTAVEHLDRIRNAISRLPEHVRLVITDVRTNTQVSPQNFGVGISQVLPVVIGAASDLPKLFAIEQPELHIHPRLQVALGDIFIHAVKGKDRDNSYRILLIETHSEHLLLRLLRRIRQSASKMTVEERDLFTSDDLVLCHTMILG